MFNNVFGITILNKDVKLDKWWFIVYFKYSFWFKQLINNKKDKINTWILKW